MSVGGCCSSDDQLVCQWVNVVTLMMNRYVSG